MAHVYDCDLHTDDGKKVATFKTHWQAVAAMIRLNNPEFVSLGGDDAEALKVESNMRRRIGLTPLEIKAHASIAR